MKKIGLVILAAMAFIMGGVINAHQVSADTDPLHERLYRVYNPNSGEHLLTPAGWEILTLEKAGWKSEGVAFYIPLTEPPYSGYPVVQRLYNPNAVATIIQQVILKLLALFLLGGIMMEQHLDSQLLKRILESLFIVFIIQMQK